MSYCTQAQVAGEFKGLAASGGWTTATTPMAADVDRFIQEADAEINATLGLKFQTPIVAAEALIIVRQISIELVASRIKEITRVKTGSPEVNQGVRGGDTASDARKRLQQIVKGLMLLPGAVLISADDGVRSFNVKEGVKHKFEKDTDQW